MSKRITMAARIVNWAREAPLEVVEEVLGIAREEVRKRRPPSRPKSTAKPKATPKAPPKAVPMPVSEHARTQPAPESGRA